MWTKVVIAKADMSYFLNYMNFYLFIYLFIFLVAISYEFVQLPAKGDNQEMILSLDWFGQERVINCSHVI